MPQTEFVVLPRKGRKRDLDDAKLVATLVKALVPSPKEDTFTPTQASNLDKIEKADGGYIYIHIGHFHDDYKKPKQGHAVGSTIDFKKVKHQCLHREGRTTPVLRTRRDVESDASPARSARSAPSASRTTEVEELKRKLAAAESQNKKLRVRVAGMEQAPAPAPTAPFILTPDILTESNVTALTGMPSLGALHALYGWINVNGYWDQIRWEAPTADSTIDPSRPGSAAGASSSSSGASSSST